MEKLTYRFVKEQIENKGYQLLSSDYGGYYHKLNIVCDKGHTYKTSWNIIRTGSSCPMCYRINQSKSMLKDFDYIKNFIENEGFTLLSKKDDYKGNYSKLKVKCQAGHLIDIMWAEFRRGVRCPICSGVKKKTIEKVKNYAIEFGYKCISKEYINGESKLEFKCPKGHQYITTWFSFQQGSRCPECFKIRQVINNSGPNCNFWKGGIANEPYCQIWIPEFKQIIRDRDGNKCLNPTCENGNNISVHHIDYNKKNCEKENLITVCRSCNSKANKDRKWHESWYKAILFRRYNYKYGV